MKRIISRILIILLIILPTACTSTTNKKNTSGDVINPAPTGEKQELTILFDAIGEINLWNENIAYTNYKSDFEKAYGVKVKLEALSPYTDFTPDFYMKRTSEYNEKLAAKLYLKNGPELIYKRFFFPQESPSIKKAIVNVKGKIKNLEKIYDAFLVNDLYYIPISVTVPCLELQKKVLIDLGIKKTIINWNKANYIKVRKQWAVTKPLFTFSELTDIISSYMDNITLFDGNQVRINTPEMKACISAIRKEIWSGNYKLDKNYTYKNYYNMIFDDTSDEFKKGMIQMQSMEYNEKCLFTPNSENALNTKFTSDRFNYGNMLTLQPFTIGKIDKLYSAFMVNKNGKNLELAYAFINGLLSKKTQLAIFMASRISESQSFYPVSKEIEGDIKTLESKEKLSPKAITLKESVLNQIKNERVLKPYFKNEKEERIYSSWYGDILQFIFADTPYTDAELTKALQILEDKYTVLLNE